MGISFQRSAKGIEDTDETRDKVFAFIQRVEQTEDDTAYSLKETVKKETVIEKERSQLFINGKDKVSVSTVNQFKGHFSRAINAVLITAGRAKFGMASKRDELKLVAMGAAVHGTAIRGIPTVNHLFNIFHNNRTGMKNVFNFFVVFYKNFLKDVHKSIMQEMEAEVNLTSQD